MKPVAAPGPVLLCGLGRVGQAILRLLVQLGRPVTVLTRTPERTRFEIPGLVRVLVGDARDERLLEEAGLRSASALIIATDDDVANLAIALHARKVAPEVPVVVRLFDEELAAHLKESIGLRGAFSASALAAPAFVAAALGESIRQVLELEGGESWVVDEIDVEEGSGAVGRSPDEGIPESGDAVLLAWKRGPSFLEPGDPEQKVQAGDALIVLSRPARWGGKSKPKFHRATLFRGLLESWGGTPRALRIVVGALLALVAASVGVFHAALGLSWVDAFYFVVTTVTTTGYGDINLQNASPFLKLYGSAVMISGCLLFAVLFSVFTDLILRTRIGDLMARGFSTTQGHSVVVGLGRVGMRVLDFLSRHRETLVTVEKDEKGAFVEQARRKSHLLIGDAQRPDTLRRAGIAGARVVVALTDDDLTNLRVALLVKRANPNCRVVTRIFDPTLAARVPATLGVDAVLSLADTAPTFVGVALSEDVIRGFVVGDRLFLLVRKVVSETGRKESGGGERLLLRRQGSGPFRPVPASGIEAGDEVIGVRWMAIGAET